MVSPDSVLITDVEQLNEATLRETYGENADADSLVVEGGVI